MILNWSKPSSNSGWYNFLEVDVSNILGVGVYIVWDGGHPPFALYVGKGSLADRLSQRQKDYYILNYNSKGPLLVSWAIVPTSYYSGVECYLIDTYQPLFNTQTPNTRPIVVNPLG